MMTIQWNDRSIDPGFPFLIYFHTHLKEVYGCEWLSMRQRMKEKNGMDKDDHLKYKMMFVIEYEESRVVYLFDDLEAPTAYSRWLRLNINNSFFFLFLYIVNSIARQLSSALYSSVCMGSVK